MRKLYQENKERQNEIEIKQKILDHQIEEIKDSRIRYIEVLGVFVALFTFVSININIFRDITQFKQSLLVMILIFLCLCGFVYVLHVIVVENKEKKPKMYALLLVALIILLFVSIINSPTCTPLIENEGRITKLEKQFESFLNTVKW